MMINAAANGTAVLALLRQTELRKFLSEAQLKDLERYARTATRKPGSTLFRQGEPAEGFFVLLEGIVELRARPPGRRVYRTIEVVQPTCTFGDESLLNESVYLASARVLETARVMTVSRFEFDRMVETQPELATGLLRCSASSLVQTVRRAAILTQSPADVGLKLLLEELASAQGGREGKTVPVRITHAQLAGVLHVSRETVSRMLRDLVAQGLVDLGRGVIRVRPSSSGPPSP
jgi:CRP/FNR family transcriptional regulator